MGNDGKEALRLDKWLWAARFFKTRSLAADAVGGGKIEINEDRAKPSRVVRIGDKLNVRRGPYEWTVIVRDISPLRDPAAQACRRDRSITARALAGVRNRRVTIQERPACNNAIYQARLVRWLAASGASP